MRIGTICVELSSALEGRTRLEPGSGLLSSSIGCVKSCRGAIVRSTACAEFFFLPAQCHQHVAAGSSQFVSALRNFLSKRSDADSTYYFLSTFLAGEERTEDRAPRRSAFSEFMRALDAHFAPASTSETAELLLERAKSFVLTPSRTLSALLEERLRAVELAGTHSQIGLYEYVRGTFSEVVEDLPRSDVSGLRSMLRQVEVARSNSGGLSDMVFLL